MSAIQIIYSILGFGFLALLVWIIRRIKAWGYTEAEIKQAKKDKYEAEKTASSLANRPHTLDDVDRMLSEFIDE